MTCFYLGAKRDVLFVGLDQTDGNGNSSRFEYDKLGRLVKTILPDNSIRTLVYDDIGNQLSATDANGNSLIYDYDGLGRLQNVKDATNTTLVKRAYDSNGVLISEWDGNKNTQQLSYDPLYRITGVSHYDKNGNMLAQTRVAYNEAYYDRFGKPFLNVTVRKKGEGQDQTGTYYFDSFGLLAKQGRIHQGQEEMSYAWYDYLGNCTQAQDYAGNRSLFSYDGRGRLLEATDALGQTVSFTYDLLGNQIAKSDALGQTAYFDYDSLGHNVATKVPYQEGQYSISKGYYDPAGNLVKTVDPEGYVTNNHYNNRNLLQAVEQIIGVKQCNITRYEYDREGNLIKLEKGLNDWNDPDFSTYTYQYDSLNRLIKTVDAEHQASTYEYDRNGNLIQSTDRNGVITGYSYDGLNRLVKKQNSRDGKQILVKSSFDQLGNLREVNDASGTTQYEYDDLGRLTHINYGNGMRQQYAYDSADRINEMIVMQGSLNQIDLKYQYDRVGRLTAVNDNGKWFTYQYDEIGRLINQQNGVNGINSEYSYYPSGNVKSLMHFNSGEIVANYEYQYDMRGNQIQKDEGANTSRYYYDALSRIKVAELPNEITQNYEYDDLNNIKEIAEIKGTQIAQTNFTYDHNSRLLLSETVNGDDLKQLRFEYDAEGNQTYKEEVEKQSGNLIASKACNFWYNGFNQLERVQDPNGDFIEYTYNAQGLRTKKDFINHAVNYIYDRGNIILESDQDYLVTAKNIRGLQLIYRETGDETLYYLHNAHGDVTKLLNDKGWVIKDYDYDPFGREETAPIKAFGGDIATEIWRNETQQIDNPFRYCGEYLDAETGNYYLRARYYDPEARRFTTEDSLRGNAANPFSLNWYAYCHNDPVNFIDPSGHWEAEDENYPYSEEEREKMQKFTDDYEKAKASDNLEGMIEAHNSAEGLRDKYRPKQSSGNSLVWSDSVVACTDTRLLGYSQQYFELTLPKDFKLIDELAVKYGLEYRPNEYNSITVTDKDGIAHIYSANMPNVRSYNGRLYVSESAFQCAVHEDPISKAGRTVEWAWYHITSDYRIFCPSMDRLQEINNQNPYNHPLLPGYDPTKPSGTINP